MGNPKSLTDINQGAIYSPDELMTVLRLDEKQIIARCQNGEIEAHRAGGKWFIPGSSVVLYFAKMASRRVVCPVLASL
jgi:hypothetical protein